MGSRTWQQIMADFTGAQASPAAAPAADYGSNADQMSRLARCQEDWDPQGLELTSPDRFRPWALDARAGEWCTEDGELAMGLDLSGSYHAHDFDVLGGELGVSGPNGSVRSGWMGDGYEVGIQGNFLEADFASTDDFSAGRDDDDSFRFGASLGVGAAGRLHSSDKDRDGAREWGFGFDAGPVSMDYKTETPVKDALLATALGPHALTAAAVDNWIYEPLKGLF